MRLMRTLPLLALTSALVCGTTAIAQQFAPAVRIVDRIDEANLVTLKGNTHPAANAKNDRGRVSPTLPMTDLILVLSRDTAQQAAFDKFVASQYDSSSPNFHQWLTPEQVGANFGPSQTDIATVTNWLTGHGFSVTEVSKDRMSIRFDGTAAMVESAFHTEIHNLEVKGVQHIGNMTDPQIPAALAPAVVGIKALQNFFPRPLHHLGSAVTRDSATGKWLRSAPPTSTSTQLSEAAKPTAATRSQAARPEFGISVGGSSPYLAEDLAPYDFATIYNVLPLWTASTPIDGSGQTIAIAGTSDIEVGQAATATNGASGANDIATFRTFFGLPTNNAANTPKRISGNSQPLTVCSSTTNTLCSQGDEVENTLDVEWSGAVAKNAQIILVASYPASASDDNLYDSESYIVNNVTARIMNVSYGECELGNGTAGNVQYYNLWQTAYSEGIAVFVAAGDSGAASCDQGGDDGGDNLPYPAEYGLSVSGLASTPYNTAVGGTDFNWCSLTSTTECTAAPYWSSSNNSSAGQSSALGYVPEVPWNDTCTNPLAVPFLKNFFGTNYSVTDAESACNALVVFNLQLSAEGDEVLLYLVDTVGGSGGASSCVSNTTSSTATTIGTCNSGATSTGTTNNPDTKAPQASISLYNNGWIKPSWQTNSKIPGLPTDGVRDIPDVSFFASDGFLSSSAYLICVSDVAPCSYSNKTEPTAQEVGGTSVATPAMAGVMALINQKTGAAQGSPNAELYALAASQTYSSCSAESVTAGSTSCYFNDVDKGTNAMACDYSYTSATPSPNCTVVHSGDYVGVLPGYSAGMGYDQATGLGSLNVANVVKAWPATVGSKTSTVTVAPATSSLNASNSLSVTVTVASSPSGGTSPTGTVTLTTNGSTFSASGTLSGSGTYVFTIPGGTLTIGTDTLTASYSGDSTYAPSKNTANVTVTGVVLPVPAVVVTPASTTLDSSSTLGITGTVNGSGAIPTGTVTLTAGSYTATATLSSSGGYTFTVPADALSSSGSTRSVTLTVVYAGDGNYQSATGSATVTVNESSFTLAASTPAAIAPGASATSTITVTAVAGYTGTVTLTCQEEADASPTTGDGATCTIPTTAVAMGGTATATVNTKAATSAALVYPQGTGRGLAGAGGGAVLAFLMFFGIPARRRSWRSMLSIVLLLMALGSLSACSSVSSNGGGGGGGQSDPGTAAGKYTFTVVATGSVAGARQQTTFTVTVN